MMDGCDQCWKKTRATGSGSARARQEDPGSSYIWLSGKVTSNLSQIPNNFCLFLPEILNSGQSVSHDFQKRKFHVINHLSEHSKSSVAARFKLTPVRLAHRLGNVTAWTGLVFQADTGVTCKLIIKTFPSAWMLAIA